MWTRYDEIKPEDGMVIIIVPDNDMSVFRAHVIGNYDEGEQEFKEVTDGKDIPSWVLQGGLWAELPPKFSDLPYQE